MKNIIIFLILIFFIVCQPEDGAIPNEDDIKKSILECIANNENASPNLRNYANENLSNGFKENIILSKYMKNETDRLIIRQCRKKAFMLNYKEKLIKIDIKDYIKP